MCVLIATFSHVRSVEKLPFFSAKKKAGAFRLGGQANQLERNNSFLGSSIWIPTCYCQRDAGFWEKTEETIP